MVGPIEVHDLLYRYPDKSTSQVSLLFQEGTTTQPQIQFVHHGLKRIGGKGVIMLIKDLEKFLKGRLARDPKYYLKSLNPNEEYTDADGHPQIHHRTDIA